MIIKCTACNEPMSESRKNRPENIPPQNKWIICRKCKGGVEVIGADNVSSTAKGGNTIEYEETIYITITQTKDGIIKTKYSDKEKTLLIGEERLG